ncbi:MAG: AAA family ATPase [Myxococcales bacterium]|nr:AAA family ATPase [Myxococcales bacterium]
MRELVFGGVRCFKDEQRVPIRPVTLLVGENSSGKSTVLALVRAAWDLAFGKAEPDFNEPPFDLGGYDAIAHFHGGQGKRAHEFTLGAAFRFGDEKQGTRVVNGVFAERAGQPILHEWRARHGGQAVEITRSEGDQCHVKLTHKGARSSEADVMAPPPGIHLAEGVLTAAARQRARDRAPDPYAFLRLLPGRWVGPEGPPRPFAGAPIRSKPERTYDPKRVSPEPGGAHVPMDLATLHATDPTEFKQLTEAIGRYGEEANLFTRLEVRRRGKKPGDPFQLTVAVERYPFNLVDVGYGVSQVLPILVDTLRAPARQTFLLQQPEVHLHPRAQAALGSLLVRQAKARRQTFLVETHSDFLVDRVRTLVREGALPADDVVILYFERDRTKATITAIEIDRQGALVDVPSGYRAFFLEEERRFLGIAGGG